MNKKIKYITILIIGLLLFSSSLFAQSNNNNNYYIEPLFRYGRTLPLDDDDTYLWNYPVASVDVRLGEYLTGNQEWHSWFNKPGHGIALRYEYHYGTVNNDSLSARLRDDLALFAFFDGTVCEAKKFRVNYSIGCGLAWWFFRDDPTQIGIQDNRFIGSHINLHINADMGFQYYFSKNYDILARIGLSHSSNAAIVLPDRGVNSVWASLGFRYSFKQRPSMQTYQGNPSIYPKHIIHLSDGIGILQSVANYKYYFGNTFQIGYSYRYSPKFRAGAGIDIMYTPEYKGIAEQRGNLADFYWYNSWNTAAYGSIEVLYNRFVFNFALGGYLYRGGAPDNILKAQKPFYERVGFKVYVDKNRKQFVGVAAKLHLGVIDYLEWTYGIAIFER